MDDVIQTVETTLPTWQWRVKKAAQGEGTGPYHAEFFQYNPSTQETIGGVESYGSSAADALTNAFEAQQDFLETQQMGIAQPGQGNGRK
jgi:hypothetical protein